MTAGTDVVAFCDHCGGGVDGGGLGSGGLGAGHDACVRARALEPPRYCPSCGRRMVVQVTPTGWTATCSRHGTTGA